MVANTPDDDESAEYPAIPEGIESERIEVSEEEECRFCGAPLWKDLVEEEEHDMVDRWFCTEYMAGEHSPEQHERVASELGLDAYRPEPGGVYAAPEGIVALAEEPSRDDPNVCYGIACAGTGAGGATLLDKRVLPWEQYVDLSEEQRELVHANHDILVKPPAEWRQYVLQHVLAFASQDGWMAGWLSEGVADRPDVEWELEPFWSAEEEARMPKNIEDVYEKYDELDAAVSYDAPESGTVYLRRAQPVVYTPKSLSLNRRQNACGLRIGSDASGEGGVGFGPVDAV